MKNIVKTLSKTSWRRELSAIAKEIDSEFYSNQVGKPLNRKESAQHYIEYGAIQNLNPTDFFSTEFYLQQNPDVNVSGINAFAHYILYGRKEGRPPKPEDLTEEQFITDEDYSKNLVSKQNTALIERAIMGRYFDEVFYKFRYIDMQVAKIHPLNHYCKYGDSEGRMPSPFFNPDFYRRKNPKFDGSALLHYAVVGKDEGFIPSDLSPGTDVFDTICASIGVTSDIIFQNLYEDYYSRRDRIEDGVLGEMVCRSIELDPLIANAKRSVITEIGIPPFRSDSATLQTASIIKLQEQAKWQRAKVVVTVPWFHLGGASRLTGHLLHALAKIYSEYEIVVINTQTSEYEYTQWLPKNCRYIDFSAACKDLPHAKKIRVLFEFIRSLTPIHTINVNSKLFWDMMEDLGTQLADSTMLSSYFFCNEKDAFGNWTGYPVSRFHHNFTKLSYILTDSEFLRDELCSRFMLSPEQQRKVFKLSTPFDSNLHPINNVKARQGSVNKVFWAGRFDRQKRVDLVLKIAESLPSIEFHLWGEAKLEQSYFKKLPPPTPNVIIHPPYDSLTDLPLDECAVWLYTSEWDGVPNMLIEVASLAIPLVGSISGGTGEILAAGLSHPVNDIEDIESYVNGIKNALNNPKDSKMKALQLSKIIADTRNSEVYFYEVAAIFSGES